MCHEKRLPESQAQFNSKKWSDFCRTLNFPVVPVVLGGADYSEIAPPNSYIDVNDFESVNDLANYLIRLSQNQEEYHSYFAWKETYFMYTFKHFCQLCEKLHDSDVPEKIVENGYKWWYERKNGELTCNDGSQRNYNKDI